MMVLRIFVCVGIALLVQAAGLPAFQERWWYAIVGGNLVVGAMMERQVTR